MTVRQRISPQPTPINIIFTFRLVADELRSVRDPAIFIEFWTGDSEGASEDDLSLAALASISLPKALDLSGRPRSFVYPLPFFLPFPEFRVRINNRVLLPFILPVRADLVK